MNDESGFFGSVTVINKWRVENFYFWGGRHTAVMSRQSKIKIFVWQHEKSSVLKSFPTKCDFQVKILWFNQRTLPNDNIIALHTKFLIAFRTEVLTTSTGEQTFIETLWTRKHFKKFRKLSRRFDRNLLLISCSKLFVDICQGKIALDLRSRFHKACLLARDANDSVLGCGTARGNKLPIS